MKTDGHFLTTGNIFVTLTKFALPFLAATVLQAFYGATDMLIVSYYGTPADLSAVSTGGQAIYAFMCLIAGLTTGGTIVIGQFFGAKKYEDVSQTIATTFTLFGVISAVISALAMGLSYQMAGWLQAPEEAFLKTFYYIFIGAAGICFTFGYNVVCAVLRGLGDSINPLKFIAAACLINVILDYLFIVGFGWGAAGASFATTLAQGFSMFLAVRFLKHRRFLFDFKLSSFKIHWDKAKLLLKVGLPISAQEFLIMLSFLFVLVVVNKMGVIASATAGITEKIDGFTILPSLAFSSAISVMVAQNIGARHLERAKKTLYTGLLICLSFGTVAFMTMFFLPLSVMMLASSHPDIIRMGADYLLAYSPDCLLLTLLFCVNGFLNGCGHTTFTLVNNTLVLFLVRLPLVWMATDLFEVGLAMPASAGLTVIIALIYFYGGSWKKSVLKN